MTQEILKTKWQTVTALTRKGSASKFPDQVKVVTVDYDDEDSLVSALTGQEFLIITLAHSAGSETHHKIVRAAARAKVAHVMPNIYTTDIVLNNEALGDEVGIGAALRPLLAEMDRLQVPWTVLVTGLWYEFSLACPPEWFGFDVAKKQVTLFDEGKSRINTTTWSQSGSAVASLLRLKKCPDDSSDASPTLEQFHNKGLYVSSFFISQRDMLDSLHRVTGTTDADWDIRHESAAKRVEDGKAAFAGGDPKGMAKAYYSRLFFKDSPAAYNQYLHNTVLNLPEESLDNATAVAVDMVKAGWSPF